MCWLLTANHADNIVFQAGLSLAIQSSRERNLVTRWSHGLESRVHSCSGSGEISLSEGNYSLLAGLLVLLPRSL